MPAEGEYEWRVVATAVSTLSIGSHPVRPEHRYEGTAPGMPTVHVREPLALLNGDDPDVRFAYTFCASQGSPEAAAEAFRRGHAKAVWAITTPNPAAIGAAVAPLTPLLPLVAGQGGVGLRWHKGEVHGAERVERYPEYEMRLTAEPGPPPQLSLAFEWCHSGVLLAATVALPQQTTRRAIDRRVRRLVRRAKLATWLLRQWHRLGCELVEA